MLPCGDASVSESDGQNHATNCVDLKHKLLLSGVGMFSNCC